MLELGVFSCGYNVFINVELSNKEINACHSVNTGCSKRTSLIIKMVYCSILFMFLSLTYTIFSQPQNTEVFL